MRCLLFAREGCLAQPVAWMVLTLEGPPGTVSHAVLSLVACADHCQKWFDQLENCEPVREATRRHLASLPIDGCPSALDYALRYVGFDTDEGRAIAAGCWSPHKVGLEVARAEDVKAALGPGPFRKLFGIKGGKA